jgi:predicted transcriptional regulator
MFKRRSEEHITSIANNSSASLKNAQHVLETQHTHGIIENTVDTLDITNEGKL